MDEPQVWLNANESDIYEAPQAYKPKAEILQAIEPV
jgi:hypothetical protein